jgi:hypothetical protein
MRSHALTFRNALALVLSVTLLISVYAQEKDVAAKGQVKVGKHVVKMTGGMLYVIRVEGGGFNPQVNINPGYFNNSELLDQGDTFQAYFVPRESKDHRIHILPSLNDDLGDGLLDYTISVKQVPLFEKPLLQEKGKLAANDPLYKNADGGGRDSHFKAYPVKLKAKALYIIDMETATKDPKFDPYLYLEGPDGKIVASDDDGGIPPNARIIYKTRREGDYKIIATTLNKAVGDYVLTVRGQK